MAAFVTISLNGMRFFADHGLYEEELKLGNEFEVDVLIRCKAPKKLIASIQQTINYVEVYKIVEKEFKERQNLLETCAMKIGDQLQQRFKRIEWFRISIKKLAPPITNFTGNVGVSYESFFK